MRYFTSSGYKQGPGLALYAMVALVSALIGGILVLTLAPGYIATRAGIVGGGPPGSGGGPGGAGGNPPVTWTGDWPVVAVADTVGPSVVGIINQSTYYDFFRGERTVTSGGSGVVLKRDDQYTYIGTNQHVTAGAEQLFVVAVGGEKLAAELVGEDWWTDLAVVRVANSATTAPFPVATLGDSELLRPGELAIAIGNPVDLEFQRSVTVGVVSGLNRTVSYGDEREFQLIQTDAAINPGSSGGPLVNAGGQVVGINSLKIATQEIESMGFAIPVNLARRVFDDLMTYGRVIRPYLGVKVANAVEAENYFQVEIERGLYVAEAIAGSPARSAGLRLGDVLLKVAERDVNSLADLRRALDLHRPGDQITLEYVRDGSTQTVTVTLAESPAAGR